MRVIVSTRYPAVHGTLRISSFCTFSHISSRSSPPFSIVHCSSRKQVPIFSLVYEKEGWITTKSNKILVTDEDNLDLAIQYIDPRYYSLAMKPAVETMIGSDLINAMVVTVGKSWASMHDDRLPHGDPGEITVMDPVVQAIGPVYFNEQVQPDPTWPSTLVDGGVTWINVPPGE
jgi:hypothetical protein